MAETSQAIRRGRAAVVYRDTGSDGRERARKVFVPDAANRLLFHAVEGAPNPYSWCRAAVETAIARRDVVAALLRYWFDDRIGVARAYGCSWNAKYGAYELRTQFVRGRHAPLHAPPEPPGGGLLRELRQDVLVPLQRRLVEAGLDGLAWQAGLGNPTATSNFVLEMQRPGGAPPRWMWVDLESSVPALFSTDLAALFRFYLPRTWRLGRPLFDDVDVPKLGEYLLRHADRIEKTLGARGLHRLVDHVKRLNECQDEWKALSRTERGIESWLVRDRITHGSAEFYRARPLRWSLLLLRTGIVGAVRGAARAAARARATLGRRRGALLRFALSPRYRRHVSRLHVVRRLRSWRGRRFLDAESARRLRGEMRRDGEGEYVADLGFHALLQPFVKTVQWGVLPLAEALGWIQGGWATFGVIAAGALARTAYTGLRMLGRAWRRQPLPWVALAVGAVPVLGNLAYPSQVLVSGVGDRLGVARFLLHDWCAALGRAIPFWGGRDTLAEHALARIPDWIERESRAGAPERPRRAERLHSEPATAHEIPVEV